MEIFGIGPLELLLILLLALIILGPKEMVETAKKAAAWLRKLRQSEAWKTTRDVMDIPNKVMKETGLDDEIRELNTISRRVQTPVTWDGKNLVTPKNPLANQEPDENILPETTGEEKGGPLAS